MVSLSSTSPPVTSIATASGHGLIILYSRHRRLSAQSQVSALGDWLVPCGLC